MKEYNEEEWDEAEPTCEYVDCVEVGFGSLPITDSPDDFVHKWFCEEHYEKVLAKQI